MFGMPFTGNRRKGDEVLSGMKFYESAVADWAQLMTSAATPMMKSTLGGMPVNPFAAGAAMATLGFAMYGQMLGMMVGATNKAATTARKFAAPGEMGVDVGRFDGLNPLPDIEQVNRYVADSIAGTPLAPWTEPKDEVKPARPAKAPKTPIAKPAAVVTAPEAPAVVAPASKPLSAKAKAGASAAKAAAPKTVTPKPAARKASPVSKPKSAIAAVVPAVDATTVSTSLPVPDVATAEPVALVNPAPAIPESAPAPVMTKPTGIERPQTPDDLKRIDGVGPKLEELLNGLGIWTFGQIASLAPGELAWIDDEFGLGGRAGRDRWIEQAAELAKGAANA